MLAPDEQLPPIDRRGLTVIPALALALMMLTAGRYGYHRDELYFLEASRHPSVGYVDQPPFAPLVAGLSRLLFGDSLVGLRLFPALALTGTVLLTGLLAREFGGAATAQRLAALCVALGPVFLISAHVAGPTGYDQVAWAAVSLLVVRILRTGDDRLWVAVGVVVGVALWNKQIIMLLVVGLLIGLLAAGQARLAASRWLWLGAAIAVAGYVPWLVWQARHGWPTLEMDSNLRREHSGLGHAVAFPILQWLMPQPLLWPVWIGGLLALWRWPVLRPYRAFATGYAAMFVLLLVLIPDRPYYLAGIFPVLFAAGARVVQEVIAGRRGLLRAAPLARRSVWRSGRSALGFVGVTGVLVLPLSLPLLPAHALHTVPLQKLNYDMGENIGWPELVQQVAGVYRALPDGQRPATIFTANYGEAGAIDRYGDRYGLPQAYSGHNSFWWWGPPPAAGTGGTTVAIGFSQTYLRHWFTDVRLVAQVHNRAGVANDEQGAPIFVCTGQLGSWRQLWPQLRHYG